MLSLVLPISFQAKLEGPVIDYVLGTKRSLSSSRMENDSTTFTGPPKVHCQYRILIGCIF